MSTLQPYRPYTFIPAPTPAFQPHPTAFYAPMAPVATPKSRLNALFQNTLVQDTLIPFSVFAGLSGLSLGSYRLFKHTMDASAIKALLQASIQKFPPLQKPLAKYVALYSPHVQQLVEQFSQNRSQGIILLGPPGTGKNHLLKAVAADYLGRHPKTLAVDITREAVQNLLFDVYTQNGQQRTQALKALQELHKGPVDTILLAVDELEQVWSTLSQLLVKATGNGHYLGEPLPALKVLMTGNHLPLLAEDAAESRMGSLKGFVDHLQPEQMAEAVMEFFAKTDATLKPALTALFQKFPGYSTRRLLDTSNGAFLALKTTPFNTDQAFLQALEKAMPTMSGSEMGSQLRRRLVKTLAEELQAQHQQTLPEALTNLLQLSSMNKANTLFRNERGQSMQLTAQEFDQLITNAIQALKNQQEWPSLNKALIPAQLLELMERVSNALEKTWINLLTKSSV